MGNVWSGKVKGDVEINVYVDEDFRIYLSVAGVVVELTEGQAFSLAMLLSKACRTYEGL